MNYVFQKMIGASLGLFLLGYAIQGYLLHQLQQLPLMGGLIGGYVLLQFLLITPVTRPVYRMIKRWFGSDVIHLVGSLTVAFFAAAALAWIGMLENLLLILVIELFGRLNLQQSRLKPVQQCATATLCSGFGLGAGWLLYELVRYGPAAQLLESGLP